MTFEDFVRTQLELRANVTLGRAMDSSSASIITWSDKLSGIHVWNVEGDVITHLAYVPEGSGSQN
jgi:hypothetical protein